MILRNGKPDEAGMLPEKFSYVRTMIPKWIDDGVTPCFVATVARKGIIVFNEGFGKLTTASDSPIITPDSLFPLCSVTKPVMCVVAMTLVEDGLLSINRPVNYYIPEFEGEKKDQVYVHQLMTHTSGMTDDAWEYAENEIKKYEEYPSGFNAPEDMDNYMYFGCKAPLTNSPGAYMVYCNFGMSLLGEILKRVSGKSLDELVRERVFNPLGMKNSHMVVPKSEWSKVVEFRKEGQWGPNMNSERSYNSQGTASGIFSTTNDMIIFAQMMLNKGSYNGIRVLSPITVDYMTRNWIEGVSASYGDEVFEEALWGLGWNIAGNKLDVESGPLKSTTAYVHGGAGRCMLWIDPQYETAGILFYIKIPPEYNRPDDLFRNIIMSSIID